MVRSICELRVIPEFQVLVKGLVDKLGDNAEFEAARDYKATEGLVRTPDEVLEQIRRNTMFSLYPELQDSRLQTEAEERQNTLKNLQADNLISKHRMNAEENIYSIPKKPITVKAQNTQAGIVYDTVGKDVKKYEALKKEIEKNNLYWIKVKETKNAYLVEVDIPVEEEVSYYRGGDFETSSHVKAEEVATKLSKQLGIDYEVVDINDAVGINPSHNGEAAFFVAGNVYFVKGFLTTKTALHEYSHPLLRSISIDNKKLFNKLYTDLISTNEGANTLGKVKVLYPELEEGSDRLKEEVLVHALTTAAEKQLKGSLETTGFNKVVNDILYAIKQLLRKAFGIKVDVAKLNLNTDLDELAAMLTKGNNFKINIEEVSHDDLVAYDRNTEKFYEDMAKIPETNREKLVDSFYDKVLRQIKYIQDNGNLDEKLDVLVNKYKEGELQEIRKNLKNYQTKINTDLKLQLDDVEYSRQQTKALLKSLDVLKNVTEHIRLNLVDISKDVDNKEKIVQASYYRNLIKTWEDFIDESKSVVVDKGSDLYNLIRTIKSSLDASKDTLNDIAEEGASGAVLDILNPTIQNMDRTYTEQLSKLKDTLSKATSDSSRKAGQAAIDRLTKDYSNQKITPETIKAALKALLTDENGRIKDANMLNSFIEGYGYNTDQVVGALHLYTKNNVADVTIKAQARANVFGNTMKPILDAIGYNPNKPSELGDKLSQIEERGYIEDGEYKTQKVRVFINERTGSDAVESKMKADIKFASAKYEETHTEENRVDLENKQAAWAKHKKDYFHQEFVPEYYAAQELLTKDAIGKEAALRRGLIQDEIDQLKLYLGGDFDEMIENESRIEELQRQIRRLSDLRDAGGRLKTEDELAISQRLLDYTEAMKKFHYSEEIPNKFQEAYNEFRNRLVESGKLPGTEGYITLMQQWQDRNTREVVRQEWWDRKKENSERIRVLMSYLPGNQKAELDISDAMDEIIELTKGYRDQDGQPIGSEMTPDRIAHVKELLEKIEKSRESLRKLSGLTPEEHFNLSSLIAKALEGKLTAQEKTQIGILMDRKSALALNPLQRAELNRLFEELREIQKRVATDYYVDTMNDWLSTLDLDKMEKLIHTNVITKNTAGVVLSDILLDDFFNQSKEFETWFKANHMKRKVFDKDLMENIEKWERISVWNVIRPSDPRYYETTVVKNEDGSEEKIQGLPSMKYFKRLVKDGSGENPDGTPMENYYTPKTVGKTVDNRGNWLAKLGKADGAPDDRYVNQEYFRIKREDSKLYTALEKMKQFHLQHQDDMHSNSRLWYDMPRYRKHVVELAQGKNLLQRIIDRIKEFFRGVKDTYDQGFNNDADNNLIRLDILDDESAQVPISGLSNLELEEASGDIAYGMLRYMISGGIQNKLIEMLPVAKAIQDTVNNSGNAALFERLSNGRILSYPGRKKDEYIRKKVVNNFIEREFQGIVNKGVGSESAWAQNISSAIFKQSSLVYLTLNIPSAIRNAVSAKFQGMVEAAAGQHMSMKSFAAAEVTSTKAMTEIFDNIYKPGSKPLLIQMMEIYDPAGKTQSQIGESITRTIQKDFKTFTWANDFRRNTELQATLQIFFGMMGHKKVSQNGTYIPLQDAWEVNQDGNIQLKSGIDAEEGITYDKDGNQKVGKKFLQRKNEMQQVISNANGAMRREESPEGKRYLAFRYISFLKSWLPAMVINRFAFSGNLLKGTSRGRVDFMLGSDKEGFYITFLKFLGKSIKHLGQNLPYMTQSEKRAAIRMGAEGLQIALLSLVISLLFDWDEDDKDRYKKLREKSGALGSEDFKLSGFLEQHSLLLLMQISSENAQFLPYTSQGIKQYTGYVTDVQSAAFGANLKTFAKIVQDLEYLATGDDRLYYKKDVGRAYSWQEEGSNKIYAHLASSIGLTGSQVDPATALKNFVSMQAKQK